MKKQILCIALGAILFTTSVSPITAEEVLKNPIFLSTLASAGLTAVYPHVGRNAMDRTHMSMAAAFGGLGYGFWSLWQLNKNADMRLLKTMKKAYLSRTDDEQEALEQFMRDRKLKNEEVAKKYIWAKIHHFIAAMTFFWSQFGVNAFWLKQAKKESVQNMGKIMISTYLLRLVDATKKDVSDQELKHLWIDSSKLTLPLIHTKIAKLEEMIFTDDSLLSEKVGLESIVRSTKKQMDLYSKVTCSADDRQEKYKKAARKHSLASLALQLIKVEKFYKKHSSAFATN